MGNCFKKEDEKEDKDDSTQPNPNALINMYRSMQMQQKPIETPPHLFKKDSLNHGTGKNHINLTHKELGEKTKADNVDILANPTVQDNEEDEDNDDDYSIEYIVEGEESEDEEDDK